MKTRLLIIIGPTAVGKSSIIDRALKDYPQLRDIITYTARPMRAGETEGHPYHFVTEARFRDLIAQNFFLEWAIVHGRLYGTPRDQIEMAAVVGQVCVMDVDVQGAKKLLQAYPEAETVFLMPPTKDALRQRFLKRGITDHADLARRLESAEAEMTQAKDFRHLIVNDDLERAYGEIRKIIENLLKNQ
jgi:guanylate kinase